jgi:anaerobic selenocysteine-containing dehydrogenase
MTLCAPLASESSANGLGVGHLALGVGYLVLGLFAHSHGFLALGAGLSADAFLGNAGRRGGGANPGLRPCPTGAMDPPRGHSDRRRGPGSAPASRRARGSEYQR